MNRTRFSLGSLLLCAVLILLVSCGAARVTVNIDALSFTSEDERTVTYGEDPVITPVGPAVTVLTSVFVTPIAGELESVTGIAADRHGHFRFPYIGRGPDRAGVK